MKERDWDYILDTFTDLYLDEKDLEIDKEDLDEYPHNSEVKSDEDLGEYVRKITQEIDDNWEGYHG